ncbi:MAG: M20/M25/M40 family metallo-hydrolase [Bacteroidia bacterium]|nr:M20/M25/M40 family metallo-hydrolase [Bacteroidia bacterium]NNF30621.1 M20/M25/M40 family metallo-hydrolase [Flavobacteriaceae bacterium]MBT8276288.1 M20/M25/M40 family metallo-hydrolase [Bacteroidia bacterium]NNJ80922.1 M20/M25/M40 family metallo-hydrolase [Flavobacteriaceae bacterium]NNK53181.1 M20/M25/M40 family metallo-hydrolase [Flavobacteriaceae bacterium]
MKKIILLSFTILLNICVFAQDTDRFYATMARQDARELKADAPDQIDILAEKGYEAVVFMSPSAAELLHGRILVHGPGYIFKSSYDEAISSINKTITTTSSRMVFNITEDEKVNEALALMSVQNIEDHIIELENYGTRYHTLAPGTQSAIDLKAKWEAMAALYGRTDVSVRLYNHNNTPMPSVIMTITGAQFPDEFVIVGGHLDSTSNQGNNDAPGADDDASGIATITEAIRTLFEADFVPQRTIEIMAYAAEEIGLVGSGEIAQEYSSNNVNISAYVQFDMTNYNGSANDVYLITDFTNSSLNGFLMQLMDHYNASGAHQFTYGTSLCNYGCSDHASWHNEGYMAAFPFEASFGQHNPNIHTPNDTFSISGTADHALKFAKLCVEFLVETAKHNGLIGVSEVSEELYDIYTSNNTLYYNFDQYDATIDSIVIYDIAGRAIVAVDDPENEGNISLGHLSSGIYIVNVQTTYTEFVNKKIKID